MRWAGEEKQYESVEAGKPSTEVLVQGFKKETALNLCFKKPPIRSSGDDILSKDGADRDGEVSG